MQFDMDSTDNTPASNRDPLPAPDMQFDLFSPVPAAELKKSLTVTERFEAFHEQHPHVYDTLVRLARRYFQATGEHDQSVQRLVEIARWDEKIRTGGESGFEINNSFRPFYARLIMWQEPDLAEVFETRVSPEADAWIAVLKHRNGGMAA